MRKLALFLAIIVVISVPLTVSANSRLLSIRPSLTYEGTTANCEVIVVGNNMSEHIEVTMTLKYGNSVIVSWSDDAYGYIRMQENATVTRGRTYTLYIEVTVNDVVKQPVYIDETC